MFYVSFIISTNTEEKHENENLMYKMKEIVALRPCQGFYFKDPQEHMC